MTVPRDLSDPDYEPSGEELQGLAARAFAYVKKNHEASQERMRREIAAERERVLAELKQTA